MGTGFSEKLFGPDEELDLVSLGADRAYNEELSPLVRTFLDSSNEEIAQVYAKATGVSYKATLNLLKHNTRYFRWSGSDQFLVFDEKGKKHVVQIETNSCPSGARTMPSASIKSLEDSAFARILNAALVPHIKKEGPLAVIYDKNDQGNERFAKVLAKLTGREVYALRVPTTESSLEHIDPKTLRYGDVAFAGVWRYVTQDPWKSIHLLNRDQGEEVVISNPIIACLAGGRNKASAKYAYRAFNLQSPIQIKFPFTTQALPKQEAFAYLKKEMQGIGVLKLPYSNAGQGVYTVTSKKEFDQAFSEISDDAYLIVQQLIGNEKISSRMKGNTLRHVGCLFEGKRYATDYRILVANHPKEGFRPCGIYSRRARLPLEKLGNPNVCSWDVLGTNLSIVEDILEDQEKEIVWNTDYERRIIPTKEGIKTMGLEFEDLAKFYVTAVAVTVAIDNLAKVLLRRRKFNTKTFLELNGENENILKDILY